MWEPEELERLLANSGAKDFAVSENNVVSLTIEQGVAPLDGLQGTVALFPDATLEQTVEIPQGQESLEPKLFLNDQGLLQCVFSDGQQQVFRTTQQQRLFSMKSAARQIALQLVNGVTLGGVLDGRQDRSLGAPWTAAMAGPTIPGTALLWPA